MLAEARRLGHVVGVAEIDGALSSASGKTA
jgi:hypothetical protein